MTTEKEQAKTEGAKSCQSIDILPEEEDEEEGEGEGEEGRRRVELTYPIRSKETSLRGPTSFPLLNDEHVKEEEFVLPTDPPITVTIQSQNNYFSSKRKSDPLASNRLTEEIFFDHSFDQDHIYSSEQIAIRNEQGHLLTDPAMRNSSNIVNYLMDLLKPSDNKLAMKLFGSRKGLLKERLRQQRAGHCIIHPCSTFRSVSSLLFSSLLDRSSSLDSIGI